MDFHTKSHNLILAAFKHKREQLPTDWKQQGNSHGGPDPELPDDKGTISLIPVHFYRLYPPEDASKMLVEPTRNRPVGASKRSCHLILVQESTFT